MGRTALWHNSPCCRITSYSTAPSGVGSWADLRSCGSPDGSSKNLFSPSVPTPGFSPTNNNKDAQHSDLRRQLLPPAHEPDMLQPGHGSGAGRALTVCKCTSTVGCHRPS
jgi:hypothetical protein